MNDSENSGDPFSNIEIVAVVGGTVDCAGNLSEDVRMCKVLQVGESDILVAELGSYSERTGIVPKAVCIPISASYDQLVASKVETAELGDLVMYYGKRDWKDKGPTEVTGILCEMIYRLGAPSKVKILSGGNMQEVDYGQLLVLQKKAKK